MNGLALLAVLLVLQAAPLAPPRAEAAEPNGPSRRPAPRGLMAELAPEVPAQNLDAAKTKRKGPDPIFDMTADVMRSDARLSDVCFVDAQHGWAVGDRGAIWHTDDGGHRWLLQESGVACPLLSLCFLDERIGWAVGGFARPYTHTSSGVVLTTRDGGRHWDHNPRLPVPTLRQVRFFDERHGWAVGCSSAMFPAGVFTSDDGGLSWMPLGGDDSPGWLAGDFLNLRIGALAGRGGVTATTQSGRIESTQTDPTGLRSFAKIRLASPTCGWLVGDGGLLMTTGDFGATWRPVSGQLPADVPEQFDFAALAVRGAKVWIAGSPGTQVFFTPDAGRTWAAFPTGQRLPIHALSFADDQHGWAVGALGAILATDDGGRTWRRQRSGGARAALLGLFSQPEDVPLELFARLSGSEGCLGVVEVLNRCDLDVKPHDEVHPSDRLHEALVAVGASDASLAWRFPVRQPGLRLAAAQIVDGWNRSNDGRGIEALRAHVVGQLRLWRPDLIITHDASPRGNDPLRHLVNQVVLQAVRDAADPACFSQQIERVGLEPWQVKKVYASLPPPSRGSTELTTAQLATRLGRSLAEVADLPRGLLEDRFAAGPQTLGFQLLLSLMPQQQGQRDFFTGIVLRPGDARREPLEPPTESLDLLRRSAEKRRNMQAILEKWDKDQRGGSQLLGQAGEMTVGLDPRSAGQILCQLGDRYYRTGRWDMAADTFAMLADRYPDHPLSRPALLWLVQYHASSEAAWRAQAVQPYDQANKAHLDRAATIGKTIEQTRPDLFAQPAIRFPLASVCRAQGVPRQAERFYAGYGRGGDRDAWAACAQGEAWLVERRGTPPKPVLTCAAASSKPRLDGKLDDSVWRQAKWAALESALHDDDDWPAAVMLACDDQFLYVALKCRKAPGVKYDAANGPRPRDADLSAHDRVDIILDLDRDYATYYRFSIDHRGWTAEDCWGDKSWDPTWFVAATAEDGCWTAEAAIPLDQLAGRRPKPGDVWAIGLQRTVPGVGFQSWSTPAAMNVMPEGFGYLMFE